MKSTILIVFSLFMINLNAISCKKIELISFAYSDTIHLAILSDSGLISSTKEADEKDLPHYLKELEKRKLIFIQYIYQDKSGSVYELKRSTKIDSLITKKYLMFKYSDVLSLNSGEQEVLFYQSGIFQLTETAPKILCLVENDMLNIGPQIAAANTFKKMKYKEAIGWLNKCIHKHNLNGYEHPKLIELYNACAEALNEIEK